MFCDMQMRKFSVLVFLRHVLVSHPINLPIIYHNMLSQGHIPHHDAGVSALDTCSTCSKSFPLSLWHFSATFPRLFHTFLLQLHTSSIGSRLKLGTNDPSCWYPELQFFERNDVRNGHAKPCRSRTMFRTMFRCFTHFDEIFAGTVSFMSNDFE